MITGKNVASEMSGDVVLVTGGSGFLGQHIVKLLQERASDVREIRVFDKKPYQNKLGNGAAKSKGQLNTAETRVHSVFFFNISVCV